MSWFSFHLNDFAVSFLSVLFEGVPFLLLGSIISGFVDVFVSPERMARLLPGRGVGSVFLSGLLGLIFPMCECGSVIVIRRFIRKGLPLSAAVTYMLASPIVSPIVAVSTFAAFRGQDPWVMTCLRLALGYILAVGAGLITRSMKPENMLLPAMLNQPAARRRSGLSVAAAPTQDFSDLAATSNVWRKLLLAVQSATADFLDVAFFLIIGAVIASVFNTAVNQQVILPLASNAPLAIGSMMVLRFLLAICSTTDAFIAASFATFPFAAKLAFLVFGPLFDFKLVFLYGVIFRRRLVFLFGAVMFVLVGLFCWQIGIALHTP
jgi:uncharacterized membrane protein YraQ (UPF0718 family)